MNYGFTINVNGNSLQEMKRIETQLQSLGIKASSAANQVNRSFDQTAEKLTDIGRKIAIAFSVEKIIEFGKQILETTAEFEGFNNRIKFASLNAYDAQRNIGFLREEVEKLHIPMRQAYEGFSEMQAGLVGTGIEGSRLRDLFEGISSAAATLHLPEYSLQRTLYDLKEIGEIGINQRIVRSLSTALPGINKIVKDTFGKSFQELEKSGISGGAFLEKLGPALTKHFSGGLENFSQSLQAKLTDAKNSFTQSILDMGEKLKPTFISILNNIKDVFNSAPIKLFIDNIQLISVVLAKTGLAWITYKGILLSVEAAEKIASITTVELGEALMSVGLFAFAAGLSFVIEKIIDMNKELNDTVDKLSNLKAVSSEFEKISNSYSDINRAFSNRKNFTNPEEAQGLYRDISGNIKSISEAIDKRTRPSLDIARTNFQSLREPTRKKDESDVEYAGRLSDFWTERNKLADDIKELGDKMSSEQSKLLGLQDKANTLLKEGLKPGKEKFAPFSAPTTGGLHGSHLSGAEGGLDRARIVNLKIDTVMRVYEAKGPELTKHAEEAVDYIIRAANNLSESQSGTM